MISKQSLAAFNRCFPNTHKYHRIFNKYAIKVSYATPNNIEYYIHKYNNKRIYMHTTTADKDTNQPKYRLCEQ